MRSLGDDPTNKTTLVFLGPTNCSACSPILIYITPMLKVALRTKLSPKFAVGSMP